MPKSSTFTCVPPRSRRSRMFSGLMSRWTMPFSCAAASTSPTRIAMSRASSKGSAPSFINRARRSSPSTYSKTM
jgi:hypothetical protein